MKLILTSIFLIFILTANGQNSKDDPIRNFEKLWSEFNLRYANFELKSVDWKEVYNQYRPQINEKSTSNELFDVSCKMLQELSDGHINLTGQTNIEKRDCGIPYTYHLSDEFGRIGKVYPLILKTLKEEKFTTLSENIGNGLINYSLSEDYGYLSVSQFEGFKIGEIKRSMNKAMTQFENKKGVIIDVRLNGGGRDKNSYKIAGRFVDKKRLGHYKKTRIKGTQNFTELESWYLNPKGNKQFIKPIVILTSDWSASATEIFVLAMKELPYVQVVGNRTEGIFSDMYNFKLPNGWKVSLSHQQYFSTKMTNYEGTGIQPDVEILNYKNDEFDNILLKAIELLDKTTDNNGYN